jgi:hypothetical protein
MDNMKSDEAENILNLFYLTKDRKALIEVSRNEKLDPKIREYASGLLMRPWLPWGKLRKIIMICLLFLGLSGFFIAKSYAFFVFVLGAFTFSPRLVAEFLLLFSKRK